MLWSFSLVTYADIMNNLHVEMNSKTPKMKISDTIGSTNWLSNFHTLAVLSKIFMLVYKALVEIIHYICICDQRKWPKHGINILWPIAFIMKYKIPRGKSQVFYNPFGNAILLMSNNATERKMLHFAFTVLFESIFFKFSIISMVMF